MRSHTSPELDVRCRTAATKASIGVAATATVALLVVAALAFGDAITNGSGSGISPAALGQPQPHPMAKLSPTSSGNLSAEVVRTSIVTDNERLVFAHAEAASRTRSESGPEPEPVSPPSYFSRRVTLGAVQKEDGREEKAVGGRDDGGASHGRRERSLRGIVTRSKGSARCFVPKDGGPSRCHPNMFYVGVSKCGTSSFAAWLEKHPKLKWVTLPHEYNAGKPSLPPEASELDPVMDYTAHWSIKEEIPYKILNSYGSEASDGTVKILVSVREPAARTISSWEYKYNLEKIEPGAPVRVDYEHGYLRQRFEEGKRQVASLIDCRSRNLGESSSFSSFMEVDLKTLCDLTLYSINHNRVQLSRVDDAGGSIFRDYTRRHSKQGRASYCTEGHDGGIDRCKPSRFYPSELIAHVGKSVYYLQLERWIKVFGQENVKVIFLEEVSADPVGALESVLTFLGIDPLGGQGTGQSVDWEDVVRTSHNLTGSKRKSMLGVQATPELVQEMRDYYEPHNAKLQELLGRPLPPNWSLPAN